MKINIDDIEPVAHDLMRHCQQRLGFKDPPGLFFAEDGENGDKLLGKTAYYDPSNKDVVVFITKRHGKDVLRSIAHELVHHMQNLRGDFDTGCETTPGYAQTNPKLRKMEAEAYLLGNMLFRDWEDGRKSKKLQEQKEKFTMKKSTIKKMIREEIMRILNEDAKNPIEEECDECPDVQEEALGQHPKAKSLKDITTMTGKGDYIDPKLTSDFEDELKRGVDPTIRIPKPEDVVLGPADEDPYELGENSGDPRPDEEGYPEPIESKEGFDADKRLQRDLEDEYKIDTAMLSLDELFGFGKKKAYPDPKHGPSEKLKVLNTQRVELIKQGASDEIIDGIEQKMREISPSMILRPRDKVREGCGDDHEELEEDLNEGDPDSPASRALTGGIRAAQKSQSDDEKAAAEKKKKEEEDKANSPASQALSRGFGPKKKTKYRDSPHANESATIRTPEIENALYESRFTSRDTKLFKKLVGKWTK